jgi:DNA-binding response OmpR family regulator
MKIVLLDPDRANARMVAHLLSVERYQVVPARDTAHARHLLAHDSPDLLLLEAQLPDGSGFDLCRRIRRDNDIPIIFLSSRTQVTDRVAALQSGADDYLGKPFEPVELLARIAAVLRRSQHSSPANPALISHGGLTLHPAEYQVIGAAPDPLILTPIEFRLLHYLMVNAGRVVTVPQLLAVVWNDHSERTTASTVTTYINRLRRKLEPGMTHSRYIRTVRDLGYMFVGELASRSVGSDTERKR